MDTAATYGQQVSWEPAKPRIRPLHLLLSWLVAGLAIGGAAWIMPGVNIDRPAAALGAAVGIAVINAILPPVLAALRLPYMVALGFILVLLADAFALKLVSNAWPSAIQVDSFGDAFIASLIVTTISLAIEVVIGTSEVCAFEELISFHGGLGGPQTRAFILHPSSLELRDGPILGAAAVHDILRGWRLDLQGATVPASPVPATSVH